MERGQESGGRKDLYGAIDKISEKTKDRQVDRVAFAASQRKADGEVKSRRVGGATYQCRRVRASRRQRWPCAGLIEAAAGRSEKSMAHRLAAELLELPKSRRAVRKREDTHRMADANKASRIPLVAGPKNLSMAQRRRCRRISRGIASVSHDPMSANRNIEYFCAHRRR